MSDEDFKNTPHLSSNTEKKRKAYESSSHECTSSSSLHHHGVDDDSINHSTGEETGSCYSLHACHEHSECQCEEHAEEEILPEHMFTSVAVIDTRPGTMNLNSAHHDSLRSTRCEHYHKKKSNVEEEIEHVSPTPSHAIAVHSPVGSCHHTIEHSDASSLSNDSYEELPHSH